MISEANAKKYCAEDISLIENYKEAVSSKELYHCHHRLEIQDDLKNKIKSVIDDNLMEPIEEKEQLIKEIETRKRSNSIFF